MRRNIPFIIPFVLLVACDMETINAAEETDTGSVTTSGTETGTETDTPTGTETDTPTGTETDTPTGTETGTDTGTGGTTVEDPTVAEGVGSDQLVIRVSYSSSKDHVLWLESQDSLGNVEDTTWDLSTWTASGSTYVIGVIEYPSGSLKLQDELDGGGGQNYLAVTDDTADPSVCESTFAPTYTMVEAGVDVDSDGLVTESEMVIVTLYVQSLPWSCQGEDDADGDGLVEESECSLAADCSQGSDAWISAVNLP